MTVGPLIPHLAELKKRIPPTHRDMLPSQYAQQVKDKLTDMVVDYLTNVGADTFCVRAAAAFDLLSVPEKPESEG